jgi:predicted small lipoprotein YifL
MRALAILICLALSLTACGYKGPLYLPKPRADTRKPPPPPVELPQERPTPSEAAPVPGAQ